MATACAAPSDASRRDAKTWVASVSQEKLGAHREVYEQVRQQLEMRAQSLLAAYRMQRGRILEAHSSAERLEFFREVKRVLANFPQATQRPVPQMGQGPVRDYDCLRRRFRNNAPTAFIEDEPTTECDPFVPNEVVGALFCRLPKGTEKPRTVVRKAIRYAVIELLLGGRSKDALLDVFLPEDEVTASAWQEQRRCRPGGWGEGIGSTHRFWVFPVDALPDTHLLLGLREQPGGASDAAKKEFTLLLGKHNLANLYQLSPDIVGTQPIDSKAHQKQKTLGKSGDIPLIENLCVPDFANGRLIVELGKDKEARVDHSGS